MNLIQKFIFILKKATSLTPFAYAELFFISIMALWFESRHSKWAKYQKKYLSDTLNYAKDHSKYYSHLLSGCHIYPGNADSILKTLPLSNKQLITEQGYNIFSNEINAHWYNWSNTGGSTGDPFRFPSMHTLLPYGNIHEMMLYHKMGMHIYHGVVSVDGTKVDEERIKQKIYYQTCPLDIYGKHHLSTLYMNDDTMPYYIENLNQLKPNLLRGYPSGMRSMARYILQNPIKIKFKLIGIYLTSESFTQEDSEIIQSAFHCPIWGQYGHTEMAVFASRKPGSEVYECSPLYGYTEVLKNGKQVRIGETGEIFVTSFTQRGVPFIRYATGDLAEYGGVKDDGTVILNHLCGRTKDFVVNKNNEKIYLIGFIFGCHLEAFNHIKNWQIQQKIPGAVNILIIKGNGYGKQTENEILRLFAKEKVDAHIKYVDYIPKTKRGKQRFILQNITNTQA